MKPHTRGPAALALLAIQLLLVLSIAGKYWYERRTCPRLWVRSAQYDPDLALRGRYLALNLEVDACALPRDEAHLGNGYPGVYFPQPNTPEFWSWNVTLHAVDGHLVPTLEEHPRTPDDVEHLTLWKNRPCDHTPTQRQLDFFIPERAKSPFPLHQDQVLWVEVTLPPSGPPRPIQIALADPTGFHPLRFE